MCSYGGKIVIRGMKRHYIVGDTRLVAIDRYGSYLEIVSQISSTFSTGSPFIIKCQLPGESLRHLVTIASDENLTTILEEQDELSANLKPAARRHLFVLPKTLSLPPKKTLKKMSGASIKITADESTEREATRSLINSRRHHKRIRSPQTMPKKENIM